MALTSELYSSYLCCPAEPEIILAPSRNTGDDYGQNVTLPCLAQGYPKPTIRWEKVGAEGFLTESSRMDVLPNGYLVIHGNKENLFLFSL